MLQNDQNKINIFKKKSTTVTGLTRVLNLAVIIRSEIPCHSMSAFRALADMRIATPLAPTSSLDLPQKIMDRCSLPFPVASLISPLSAIPYVHTIQVKSD